MSPIDPSLAANEAHKIEAFLSMQPEVGALREALGKSGFKLYLFGGAIRDLLLGRSCYDIDLLTIGAADPEKPFDPFLELIKAFGEKRGLKIQDCRPFHIELHGRGSKIDLRYPSKTIERAVVRSDFTVDGIAYDLASRSFNDPLKGLEDFRARRLRVHSPAYFITNPVYFPRAFRIAALIGFDLPKELLALIHNFRPMVSMHSGQAMPMVLIELLRLLSIEEIAPYLSGLISTNLLENLIPEIVPLAIIKDKAVPPKTLLQLNVEAIESSAKWIKTVPEPVLKFLKAGPADGSQITMLGCVRFGALFRGFGSSYELVGPASPYRIAECGSDNSAFEQRMQRNVISFMAARYAHTPLLKALIGGLPLVLELTEQIQTKPAWDVMSANYQRWSGSMPVGLPQQALLTALIAMKNPQGVAPATADYENRLLELIK
ncbi:MAG: hypothetical protein K1X83_04290 [Oligoflexia bacterium]|nr:hypothetical protein [Oligoflexia bacterium]